MKIEEAIQYFATNYPNSRIYKLPEDNPTEILCEVDPAEMHPNYSMLIAAISATDAHYHQNSVVEYEVLSGTLLVNISGQITTLYEHEKMSIPAGQVHASTSVMDWALVKIVAQPGWTIQDHIRV